MQIFLKIEVDQQCCYDHLEISVLSLLSLGFSLFSVPWSIDEHDLFALLVRGQGRFFQNGSPH